MWALVTAYVSADDACGWNALDQALWTDRSHVLLARTIECAMGRPDDNPSWSLARAMDSPFVERFLECALQDTHSSTSPTRCTSLIRSTIPANTWGSTGVRVGYLFHSNRFSCAYPFDAGTPSDAHRPCDLDDMNSMDNYARDWVGLREEACANGDASWRLRMHREIWRVQGHSPLACCHKTIDDIERVLNMFYFHAAVSDVSQCVLGMTETQINAYWTPQDVVGIFYVQDHWRPMAELVRDMFQSRIRNVTLPLVKMPLHTLPGVCLPPDPPASPTSPPPASPSPASPPPASPPPASPPPGGPPSPEVRPSLFLGIVGGLVLPFALVSAVILRYQRPKTREKPLVADQDVELKADRPHEAPQAAS